MSNGQFESPQASPFSDLQDQRFFHSSLPHLEALTTLRSGIEARKGFILFTGDAGTGKSMLLQELTRELCDGGNCALISDPHLSFAEILRSILLQLEAEPESPEERALLRQCLSLLRAQLDRGRLMAVVFDDAHHLRDKVIELMVHHFVGANPLGPHKHLAQIILAGRPELKERFFRPPLRSLESPTVLECQLRPLSEKEVGEYIEHRLRVADLPMDLFGPDTFPPIAAYSGGKLRLANALCDRALRSADFSMRQHISPELIDAAAKDLALWQPQWIRKETSKKTFTTPKEPDPVAGFKFGDDMNEAVGQTFRNVNDTVRKGQPARAISNGTALQMLTIVVVLGVSALWLQSDPGREYLHAWGGTLGKIVGSDPQIPAQAKFEAGAPAPLATEELVASTPLRSTIDPPQEKNQKISDFPAAEAKKSAELPAPAQEESPPVKNLNPPPQKAPERTVRERQVLPREYSDQQKRELATQVSKAIENRAIPGIDVSVIDGTAYLNGRVATERQRNAAERAAHSVPDVREVQNRITIE